MQCGIQVRLVSLVTRKALCIRTSHKSFPTEPADCGRDIWLQKMSTLYQRKKKKNQCPHIGHHPAEMSKVRAETFRYDSKSDDTVTAARTKKKKKKICILMNFGEETTGL